jgi:hypothetical protein
VAERQNKQGRGDDERDLERALEKKREDLPGDIEENRNLTGSTTWETLDEESGEGHAQPRKQESASRQQESREEQRTAQPNPPYTTRGPITAPKFGSAGSGGLENEPGPEKD